jgi:hypothetical protein
MNRLMESFSNLHVSVHRESAFVFATLFKLSISASLPLPRNPLFLSYLITEVYTEHKGFCLNYFFFKMDYFRCSPCGFPLGQHLGVHLQFQNGALLPILQNSISQQSSYANVICSVLSWNWIDRAKVAANSTELSSGSKWVPPQDWATKLDWNRLFETICGMEDLFLASQCLLRLSQLKGTKERRKENVV